MYFEREESGKGRKLLTGERESEREKKREREREREKKRERGGAIPSGRSRKMTSDSRWSSGVS